MWFFVIVRCHFCNLICGLLRKFCLILSRDYLKIFLTFAQSFNEFPIFFSQTFYEIWDFCLCNHLTKSVFRVAISDEISDALSEHFGGFDFLKVCKIWDIFQWPTDQLILWNSKGNKSRTFTKMKKNCRIITCLWKKLQRQNHEDHFLLYGIFPFSVWFVELYTLCNSAHFLFLKKKNLFIFFDKKLLKLSPLLTPKQKELKVTRKEFYFRQMCILASIIIQRSFIELLSPPPRLDKNLL